MDGIEWSRVIPIPLKNDTIVVIGGGRSLAGFDFTRLRDKAYLIAINDSGDLVPFADAWFTLDPWGLGGPQLPNYRAFKGILYAAVPDDFGTPTARARAHRIEVMRKVTFLHRLSDSNKLHTSSADAYRPQLSDDTGCISTGNSGYGAFNLAYHLKPKRIILMGLDGDIGYHYTEEKTNRRLTHLPTMFASTVDQITRRGIEVLNASEKSTITAYPRMSIDEALRSIDA